MIKEEKIEFNISDVDFFTKKEFVGDFKRCKLFVSELKYKEKFYWDVEVKGRIYDIFAKLIKLWKKVPGDFFIEIEEDQDILIDYLKSSQYVKENFNVTISPFTLAGLDTMVAIMERK